MAVAKKSKFSQTKNFSKLWLFLAFFLGIALSGLFFWGGKEKGWFLKKGPLFQIESQKVTLEKKFSFPAQNNQGRKNEIAFILNGAEKTNQIYFRNRPLRAGEEQSFLVLTLQLQNETPERLYFYSADFVRLIDKEERKFEADFKSPRFEIAPFSTKKDKLVFLVPKNQNEFKIQVGELEGTKETIRLSF